MCDRTMDSFKSMMTPYDRQISIGTMGIGAGALIAGLFGMNVRDLSFIL
jgi:magnesium transporter